MTAQSRLSDITEHVSKIAPQRPGLQHGYHGDPTAGANNSLSAPKSSTADRQTDGDVEKEDLGEEESKKQDEFECLCFNV